MADEKIGADSPLAELIDWDAMEAPEQEESSLKEKEEKPAEEKPAKEEAPEANTKEEVGEQKTETKEEAKEEQPKEEPKKEETPAPQVNEEELRSKLEQELRDSIAKEYEAKQPKFANETIKKLNELAQAGVDVDSNDFWAWQSRDLDNYDLSNKNHALELRRLELEMENPEFTKDEIDWKIGKEYRALFDDSLEPDDEEYKDAMMSLRFDAKKSVTKLRAHKEKVTLPKVDLKAQEAAKEQAQKAQEAFVMETRKTVNNYKEEPYKLSDDLEIKFQISDEARKFAESAIVNNQSFFLDNYTEKDENGAVAKVDFPRLTRDMTRLAQFDDFIKAAFEQGVSKGKDETVDGLENAGDALTQSKQERGKTYEEQIAEQLSRQFSKTR